MPWLIIAVNSPPELSGAWWVTNALVPFVAAVLGAVATIGAACWVVKKTEFYRRLARWEPFGDKLWAAQLDLYETICQAAFEAMGAALDLGFFCESNAPERGHKLTKTFCCERRKIQLLGIRAKVLLSSEFNQVYGEFERKQFMLGTTQKCGDNWRKQAARDLVETMELFSSLLEVSRKNLGVDELGNKARQAIIDGLNQQLVEVSQCAAGSSG